MLTSSSVSVADAYTIWTDVNEINGVSTLIDSKNKFFKIKLFDKTAAGSNEQFSGMSIPYKINLFDGVSAKIVNDVFDNGIPYQISLFDGVLSKFNKNVNNNPNEKTFALLYSFCICNFNNYNSHVLL